MNLRNGAKRLQQAGKWIALPPTAVSVLCGIGFLLNLVIHLPFLRVLFVPVFFCIQIAGFGLLLWLSGWIVEGFADDPQ
jgi:hypothetical protein